MTTVGDGPAALKILEGVARRRRSDRAGPHAAGDERLRRVRGGAGGRSRYSRAHLSARTLAKDRARGFDLGANQYMTKPFDLDEFLSRVRNLLSFHRRRSERRAESPTGVVSYEFAEAKINFETFKVTINDEPVRMTQLELSLLRYFVENEGRVIPRRELLENVWGMPGNLNTGPPTSSSAGCGRFSSPIRPSPAISSPSATPAIASWPPAKTRLTTLSLREGQGEGVPEIPTHAGYAVADSARLTINLTTCD